MSQLASTRLLLSERLDNSGRQAHTNLSRHQAVRVAHARLQFNVGSLCTSGVYTSAELRHPSSCMPRVDELVPAERGTGPTARSRKHLCPCLTLFSCAKQTASLKQGSALQALVNLDLSQQTAAFAPFTASKESDSADAQALESSTPPEDAKSQNGTPTLKEHSSSNGTAATVETVSYDLFIGADGFWSRSRAAFVEQVSCSELMVGSENHTASTCVDAGFGAIAHHHSVQVMQTELGCSQPLAALEAQRWSSSSINVDSMRD